MMAAQIIAATIRNAMNWHFLSRTMFDFAVILRKKKPGRDPNTALESLERLSRVATFIILLGILVEIAIAARHFDGWPTFLEHAVPDVLIALGLAIEYVAIGHVIEASQEAKSLADKEVEALKAQGAIALRQAKQAELELERFKAPRALSEHQCERLRAALSQFAGIEFDAAFAPGDPEAQHLCIRLMMLLRDAGWKPISWRALTDPPSVPATGFAFGETSVFDVGIDFMHLDNVYAAEAAVAVVKALNSEGIKARAGTGYWEMTSQKASVNHTAVHVLVSRKT